MRKPGEKLNRFGVPQMNSPTYPIGFLVSENTRGAVEVFEPLPRIKALALPMMLDLREGEVDVVKTSSHRDTNPDCNIHTNGFSPNTSRLSSLLSISLNSKGKFRPPQALVRTFSLFGIFVAGSFFGFQTVSYLDRSVNNDAAGLNEEEGGFSTNQSPTTMDPSAQVLSVFDNDQEELSAKTRNSYALYQFTPLAEAEAELQPKSRADLIFAELDRKMPVLSANQPLSLNPLLSLQVAPDGKVSPSQEVKASSILKIPFGATIDTHATSKVKFLSGLIAANRPTIRDCGTAAKDIVELSGKEGVDPFYIAAIISVESRFAADVRSHAGATGLMQILPSTAEDLQNGRSSPQSKREALTNPRLNISLGIDYIKQLEQHYRGNRSLALAAYNWGPGNVDRALIRRQTIPSAVQNYARKVIERTENWSKHYLKSIRAAGDVQAGLEASA